MKNDKAFKKLWHDIAVGMFYRAQAEANPKDYRHWAAIGLAAKLHYQAKARLELSEFVKGEAL